MDLNQTQKLIVSLLDPARPMRLFEIQSALYDAHGVELTDDTLRRYMSLMAKAGAISRSRHGLYLPVGAQPDTVDVWLAKECVRLGQVGLTRAQILAARQRAVRHRRDTFLLHRAIERLCDEGVIAPQSGGYLLDPDAAKAWLEKQAAAVDFLMG